MTDIYTNRHQHQRIIKDADQAEFAAVTRGTSVLDAGVYDDRVAGALDDFDVDDPQRIGTFWHHEDLQYDTAVGGIRDEVGRRQTLLGAAYPFEVRGNELVHRVSQSGFYEFCLAICCAETITRVPFVDLPRAFERVSALLVRSYLGNHSDYLHVGSPRDDAIGVRFVDAMRSLHDRTKEWLWSPQPGLPDELNNTGDEGVDFVVWKRSLDSRPGHLFILGQCACGDDWINKFSDLDLKRLGKWFNPLSYVDPVRAFVTPHHLADGNFLNALLEAGMLFDRARLTLIAEGLVGDADYLDWSPRVSELSGLVMPRANAMNMNE